VRSLFATYLGQAFQDPLHRHGWNFYFIVLAYEWPVLVLAAAGVWRAWVEREAFLRFACVYTLAMAVMYSALPYKTPWCALNFWFPLLLVAGAGAAWLVRAPEIGLRIANAVVLTVGFANLSWQAWSRSVPEAVGPDNPYAYAHTSADVFLIRDRVGQLAKVHPDGERMPVQIVTTQNLWPLPWYLRRYPNVRWWRAAPEKDPVAPVILLTPDFEPALTKRLYQTPPPGERELFMNIFERAVEIRPGVELRGFARKSLWDRTR
jgi:predicted membrane-bound mannosyltransferase